MSDIVPFFLVVHLEGIADGGPSFVVEGCEVDGNATLLRVQFECLHTTDGPAGFTALDIDAGQDDGWLVGGSLEVMLLQ